MIKIKAFQDSEDYFLNNLITDFIKKTKIRVKKIENKVSYLETGIRCEYHDDGYEITVFNDMVRGEIDVLYLLIMLSKINIQENYLKENNLTNEDLLNFIDKYISNKETAFVIKYYTNFTYNMYEFAFAVDYLIKTKVFKEIAFNNLIKHFSETSIVGCHLFEPIAFISAMRFHNVNIKVKTINKSLNSLISSIEKSFQNDIDTISKSFYRGILSCYKITYTDIFGTMGCLNPNFKLISKELESRVS